MDGWMVLNWVPHLPQGGATDSRSVGGFVWNYEVMHVKERKSVICLNPLKTFCPHVTVSSSSVAQPSRPLILCDPLKELHVQPDTLFTPKGKLTGIRRRGPEPLVDCRCNGDVNVYGCRWLYFYIWNKVWGKKGEAPHTGGGAAVRLHKLNE